MKIKQSERDELDRIIKLKGSLTENDMESIFNMYNKYVGPQFTTYVKPQTCTRCNNSIITLYFKLKEWWLKTKNN